MRIRIIFFVFALARLPAWQDTITVEASPTTYQGDWMVVLVSGYANREGFDAQFLVRLLSPTNRELIRKETFPLIGTFGWPSQALVLGMYINWEPGTYIIEVSSLRTDWSRSLPVELKDAEFPSAELTLNRALTQLVTQPNPQKEVDRVEFIAILDRYVPAATQGLPLFVLPLRDEHRRSSPFGVRRTIRYATGASAVTYHWGVDLAGPEGTPIYAPADGTVVLAKSRIVSGNTVILEHMPGVLSIYYHLHTIGVEVGQSVKAGDLLGHLGTTGLSTGPHLHWEVRIHGIPIEPLALLTRGLLDTTPPER